MISDFKTSVDFQSGYDAGFKAASLTRAASEAEVVRLRAVVDRAVKMLEGAADAFRDRNMSACAGMVDDMAHDIRMEVTR